MGVTERLAGKITGIFISRGIIAEEDADLYKYGIESGISVTGNFLASLIFGLVTGRLGNVLAFLFFYGMLRSYSGGMHCKSRTGCFVMSILILFIPAYFGDWIISVPMAITIICGIAAVVLILVLSPVESINKPLDEGERDFYGKMSRGIVIWQLCALSVLYCMDWTGYFYAGYSSILLVAVFLVMGRLLYRNRF